jgi:hypothetical protein
VTIYRPPAPPARRGNQGVAFRTGGRTQLAARTPYEATGGAPPPVQWSSQLFLD